MIRTAVLLATTLALASSLDPPRAEAQGSFSQVTVRKEAASGKARRQKGTLSFGEQGLTFDSRKIDFELPYEAIRIVHRGTLGTDVDTEWIVITATYEGRLQRIGIRDGKKLGYGARIDRFDDALTQRLAEGGHAHFAAPAGFSSLATPDHRLALAAPEGAQLRVVDAVIGEDGALATGVLALEAPGVEGAWTIVIRKSPRRSGCDDYDEQAVAERLAADGYSDIRLEPVEVAHCDGAEVHARRSGNAVVGRSWINGERSYALLVETVPERLPVAAGLLDRVAATLKLPLLR